MNDASNFSVMSEITDVVRQCDEVLAHAWMVRTFIKHCEEIEDYTELMGIVRAVFDISRALETRLADPIGYLKMLNKKLSKLRQAVEQFAMDAPKASTHTNFQQAVKSMNVSLRELQTLSARGQKLLTELPLAAATAAAINEDDADESRK